MSDFIPGDFLAETYRFSFFGKDEPHCRWVRYLGMFAEQAVVEDAGGHRRLVDPSTLSLPSPHVTTS